MTDTGNKKFSFLIEMKTAIIAMVISENSCPKQTKMGMQKSRGPVSMTYIGNWHPLILLLKRRGYNCNAGLDLKFTMDNHSGRRDRKGLTGCLGPVATNPVMLWQIIQGAAQYM